MGPCRIAVWCVQSLVPHIEKCSGNRWRWQLRSSVDDSPFHETGTVLKRRKVKMLDATPCAFYPSWIENKMKQPWPPFTVVICNTFFPKQRKAFIFIIVFMCFKGHGLLWYFHAISMEYKKSGRNERSCRVLLLYVIYEFLSWSDQQWGCCLSSCCPCWVSTYCLQRRLLKDLPALADNCFPNAILGLSRGCVLHH